MELTPTRAARLFLVIALLVGTTAAAGSAATTGTARTTRAAGVLTGTWAGVLSGSVGSIARRERIRIVINARESGGSWKVSATCHGSLTLDSISGGSHHYRRHLARGASCHGGDIDCLWPSGAGIYDNVTPRPGGWSRNGTLHRVRTG